MSSAEEHRADTARTPEQYSGRERAAIAMLCLGEQTAANIMRMLEDDEVREISDAMSSLGSIPAPVVEYVVQEFFTKISASGFVIGSLEQTERMLLKVLAPDRVADIMGELRGPAGRSVWDKLGNVNQATLAAYLTNEYPQTVAVVLTKVPAPVAAGVLSSLPHDFAVETIQRMLNMENVQREILDKIETTLRLEFISNLNRTAKRDNYEMMAEIFNSFDRANESKFISLVEGKAHESADRIRSLMFIFDDLGKLDSGAVQTLLRSIDKADLALALKGATAAMTQLFLGNMSERGAKLLREEMAAMGPVRARDVDAARARIVAAAKDLAARGEIMLSGNGVEDELIY